MDVLSAIGQALLTGAGLFWKALWALALGYAVSASIQVFVARREAAEKLGRARIGPVALAMGMGFASSSCSFAALSATKSLFTKGAHLIPSLAFMFASTNLAIEVAALAFVFLGWQFALALFVGAPILVAVMAATVAATRPAKLTRQARKRAESSAAQEMERTEGLPERVADRFRSRLAWVRVGRAYVGEWAMVWKELLFGFLVAGAVAALVPRGVFEALFPAGLAIWILVPLHAALAPVLAVFTVIGSMGNGPLAAVLWQNGVAFAGIMAFLYSDFIVPPSLKINAKYYGWRFATYLGVVFAGAAVVAGIAVHALFSGLGLIPTSAKPVVELARFSLDYTFYLNVFSLLVSGALVWISRQPARVRRRATEAAR